jgi:hypothetical protein
MNDYEVIVIGGAPAGPFIGALAKRPECRGRDVAQSRFPIC